MSRSSIPLDGEDRPEVIINRHREVFERLAESDLPIAGFAEAALQNVGQW